MSMSPPSAGQTQATANAKRMVLVNEDGSRFAESPSRVALGSAVAHATSPLPWRARAVSFSAVGTLHIVTAGGDNVTIPSGSLAAGMQHAIEFDRLIDDSTAANIVVYG